MDAVTNDAAELIAPELRKSISSASLADTPILWSEMMAIDAF